MAAAERIFDIAVIGAGMAGAGVAAHLAADGQRVVVLEAEERPGYHSTGRSAAIYLRSYGNRVINALTVASGPALFHPPAAWGVARVLSPRGLLVVAMTAQETSILEADMARSPYLEPIPPAAAAALVPILSADRVVAAAYEREAADIDVAALHQAFLRMLTTAGGRLLTDAAPRSLDRAGDHWVLTLADGSTLEAGLLINAAGAWADRVAMAAGVGAIGVQPRRRSMAVVPGLGDRHAGFDRWPFFGDAAETWYAKPDAGRLMISPADEDPVEPQDAFVDDLVLAEGLDRFTQATGVEITRVEHSWAGLRSFAADRSPVVGHDPRVPGFFWLAGQGGYGIQTAPALSALAARLVLGRGVGDDLEPWVVAALDPARLLSGTGGPAAAASRRSQAAPASA